MITDNRYHAATMPSKCSRFIATTLHHSTPKFSYFATTLPYILKISWNCTWKNVKNKNTDKMNHQRSTQRRATLFSAYATTINELWWTTDLLGRIKTITSRRTMSQQYWSRDTMECAHWAAGSVVMGCLVWNQTFFRSDDIVLQLQCFRSEQSGHADISIICE